MRTKQTIHTLSGSILVYVIVAAAAAAATGASLAQTGARAAKAVGATRVASSPTPCMSRTHS